jgi:hypothetical protein
MGISAQASGYGCVAPGVAFHRLTSGWHPTDTSDAQEALDTLEIQAIVSDEKGHSGALLVCGDQLGNVALIEAVTQAH